jgi:phage recombination protein Bet
MSNDIVVAEQWSPEKIQLIKNTVAVGATDLELALFSEICKKKGLDPFSRQIHFIKRKRWNAQTRQQEEYGVIQTGIDGYRAIAERTGKYAGQDRPEFEEKANEAGKFWPIKATVTVYKLVAGQKCAFSGEARLLEYAQYTTDRQTKKQILNSMWAKMPYGQLAKCAEALALRKAFPQDLSGIYTNEEMGQADNELAQTPIKPTVNDQNTPGGGISSSDKFIADMEEYNANPSQEQANDAFKSPVSEPEYVPEPTVAEAPERTASKGWVKVGEDLKPTGETIYRQESGGSTTEYKFFNDLCVGFFKNGEAQNINLTDRKLDGAFLKRLTDAGFKKV